jgi:hypothetical protein
MCVCVRVVCVYGVSVSGVVCVCVCVFACVDVRDTKWKKWSSYEGELTS